MFRTDAAQAIGTGHLMRCLALAEGCLDRGWEVVFAAHKCSDLLVRRLADAGITVIILDDGNDAAELQRFVHRHRPSVIVIDGYQFDERHRKAVAQFGLPVVAIDDGNLPHPLHADIIVNPSPLATACDYVTCGVARLLLGPVYVPLRNEFKQIRDAPAPCRKKEPSILLTFGGSDPLRLTAPVLEKLLTAFALPVIVNVIVGAAGKTDSRIKRLLTDYPNRVRIHANTRHMASLMATTELAISAAGTTLWELASLRIPTIAVVVADNQAAALAPPMNRWFLAIDARVDVPRAPAQIVAAAESLWLDHDRRVAQTEALRRVGVGDKAATILDEIAGVIR